MTRRPSSTVRLALLGDVLKLLRQRRRPVRSVIIHPDATIEVRLAPPSETDAREADLDDELDRWLRDQGED